MATVTIVNVDDISFSINGIRYIKNFVSIVNNDSVKIVGVYDSKLVLQQTTNFSNYIVNTSTFSSSASLQSALVEVLFNRDLQGFENRISNLEQNQLTGVLYFSTKADMLSADATGQLNVAYKVISDANTTLNGDYTSDGATYTQQTFAVNGIIESGNVDAVNGDKIHTENEKLKDDLGGRYFNESPTTNFIRKSNGELATTGSGVIATDFISLKNVNEVNILGRNGTTPTICAFYDVDKIFISSLDAPIDNSDNQEVTILLADFPEGAKYFRSTSLSAQPHFVRLIGIDLKLVNSVSTENSYAIFIDNLILDNTIHGLVDRVDGEYITSSVTFPDAKISEYIEVEEGQTYYLHNRLDTNGASGYDENLVPVKLTDNVQYILNFESDGSFTIPTGTGIKFIAFTLRINDGDISNISLTEEEITRDVPVAGKGSKIEFLEDKGGKNLKVLLVGSSFGIDAIMHFPILAAKAGVGITCGNLYESGIDITGVDTFAQNDTDFLFYSINEGGGKWDKTDSGVGTRTLLKAITDFDWDVIILQRGAHESDTWTNGQRDSLFNVMDYIKENINYNPEIMFNTAHSFPIDTVGGFTRQDQIDRTALINSTAQEMQADAYLDIIPNAIAVQNARSTFLTDFGTWDDEDIARDDLHLDSGIGNYVTGCTMFEKILGKRFDLSIRNLDYIPIQSDIDGILGNTGFTTITEEMARVAKLSAIAANMDNFVVAPNLAINYPPA